MIRSVILLVSMACLSSRSIAQPLISFEFTSEEDNKFIKENDSCKYYVSSGDTALMVCLNEDASFYKLLNRSQRVLAEGSYIVEGDKFLQTGRWTERYDNGKTKLTGSYRRNKPIGTWQEFYPTGKPKSIYNYAVVISEKGATSYCLSGSWQEFYPDGKLKTNGYYSANETKVADTIVVDDPISDQKVMKTSRKTIYNAAKTGTWEYYLQNGELDKKEEF